MILTTSSFEGATSESEINDSRFNDISCISYADRTIDEKDNVSRNDVSKEEANTSSLSFNNANTSAESKQFNTSHDN